MSMLISDMARSSVKASRRKSLAIRLTIFLAVLVMGAYLFSFSLNWEQEIQATEMAEGDYHVELRGIQGEMLEALKRDEPERITLTLIEEQPNTSGARMFRVQIRCRNIRDSYTYCRELLTRFGLAELERIKAGQVIYHTHLLELRGVFPDGFTPHVDMLSRYLSYFVLMFILLILFAFLIASAFRQWQTENRRELALLQSAGMEDGSLKSYMFWRSFYLSRFPMSVGLVCAYLLGMGLKFYVWRFIENSSRAFHFFYPVDYTLLLPQLMPFLILLILSVLCIVLATFYSYRAARNMSVAEAIRFPVKGVGLKVSANVDFPVKKVEAGLARLFHSFYSSREKSLLLLLAIGNIWIGAYDLYDARTVLDKTAQPPATSYLVERIFWIKGSLLENLKEELENVRANQGIELVETEVGDKIFITLRAEREIPDEAAALDYQLQETVEKYLDPGHWVGLGSLITQVLDQGLLLSSRIWLSIWFWSLLSMAAVYSFQSYFALYLSREEEFSLLTTLGMSRAQFRKMLFWELFYTLRRILLILAGEFILLSLAFSLLDFWRFSPLQLWSKIRLLPFLLYPGTIIGSTFSALYVSLKYLNSKQKKAVLSMDGF